MKKEENNGYRELWIIIAATSIALWVLLILVKCTNLLRLSWLVVLLGCFWISPALILTSLVVYNINKTLKQLPKRRAQRKMLKNIHDSMKIFAMNEVGIMFGVKREPGESNRHFRKRIDRAAIVIDNAQRRTPAPATGEKLDIIAANHGLTRGAGETDKELQERVRQKVRERLERGEY